MFLKFLWNPNFHVIFQDQQILGNPKQCQFSSEILGICGHENRPGECLRRAKKSEDDMHQRQPTMT